MIDINFDFQKTFPSFKKASVLLKQIDADAVKNYTVSGVGRKKLSYFGETEIISFMYEVYTRTLHVSYKDGRGERWYDKARYYILWIEGLKPEYLKDIYEHTYTTKKTDAMRVRAQDLPRVREVLKEEKFSQWTINSPSTYVRITSGRGKFFHKLR